MTTSRTLLALAALLAAARLPARASDAAAPPAPEALSVSDAARLAQAANPQVQAAKAQYEAALHQIDQAYAPQDPQLSLALSQTPNGFTHAQTRSVGIGESFQFPGKAWLQGDEAHRAAEIARLVYLAAARDARAQALTAYYQTLLDSASVSIALENLNSFGQVLKVVEVAYSASQAAQSDLIGAELGVTQSSQTLWTSQVAEGNDEAALNLALGRLPETPLVLAGATELKPLPLSLDAVRARARATRQEILEAALSERNARTARRLAWMELLPDFSASWARNNYPPGSINAPPAAGGAATHDFSTGLSLNVPLFFWFKQREDVRAADRLLEAARAGRRAVELQTETSVVQIYRSTELAYRNARLYKELLIPLAAQNFRVTLVAYQSKKVDYLTLSTALQNIYNTRVGSLTAANQYLAGRVALEQAMGAPFE